MGAGGGGGSGGVGSGGGLFFERSFQFTSKGNTLCPHSDGLDNKERP